MKSLSLAEHIQTVSFDIDGTVYPMRKMEIRWWKNFFLGPKEAIRFFQIKKTWEKRRKGSRNVDVTPEDVIFFENFLTSMMDERLVPGEIRELLQSLKVKLFFLSDHGAKAKLEKLGLSKFGIAINCLSETGELKPHPEISRLLISSYGIDPRTHLHVGDRWSDEEQARLFGCEFQYFKA